MLSPLLEVVQVLGPTIGNRFDKSRFFAYCTDTTCAFRRTRHWVDAREFASGFSKAARPKN